MSIPTHANGRGEIPRRRRRREGTGNFQRGGRVKLKEASEGGVGAFSGSTYSIVFNGLLCTSNEAKSHIL